MPLTIGQVKTCNETFLSHVLFLNEFETHQTMLKSHALYGYLLFKHRTTSRSTRFHVYRSFEVYSLCINYNSNFTSLVSDLPIQKIDFIKREGSHLSTTGVYTTFCHQAYLIFKRKLRIQTIIFEFLFTKCFIITLHF